jgi:uncharacterized protein
MGSTAMVDPVPPVRSLGQQLEALDRYLHRLGSLLVCYSGGVDSALLLALAHRALGPKAIGLLAVSPSLAPGERTEAQQTARGIGADLRLVETRELADPCYASNGPDRCFHCKSELYRIAHEKRREWQLEAIANGTNADDLGDYRPGLEAGRKAGILSPFLELGWTKADIRAAANHLGLGVWDKPAAACLALPLPPSCSAESPPSSTRCARLASGRSEPGCMGIWLAWSSSSASSGARPSRSSAGGWSRPDMRRASAT